MLRRRTILESHAVDLLQRDKDRLLIMSVGGTDLFDPYWSCLSEEMISLAPMRKVQEWKKDTKEEKVKLISRVFDEREQCDKTSKKKSASTSVHRPRSLSHQSPLDILPSPRWVGGGGGRASSLPITLAGTFSAVSGNHPESLSRHSDSLQWWCPDTSSPSSGVTQQQQALRPSSSCEEALRLPSHRRSEGHLVPGLLQLPVFGSQTQQIVQTNHRSHEIKSISGRTFDQDGNSLLHNSSSAATWMDYQDRPQRCLSSYPGPCEHPQVFSLCYSWKDLSVPCAPVWSFDSTQRVHKDLGPVSSAALHQRGQSPCLSGRPDHPSGFTRTESSAYQTNHPTFTNFGIDYQLEEVYTRTLMHNRLLGTALQSRTSHCFFSFLDSLISVLSRLSASTVMPACKITSITSRISHFAPFIHHGCLNLRFLQFWIKRHWLQHTQSWDTQIQLDTEFLTHLRWFNRREVLQGVPLHPPYFSSPMHH